MARNPAYVEMVVKTRQRRSGEHKVYAKNYYQENKGTWLHFFRQTWPGINARTVNGTSPNYRRPSTLRYLKRGIEVRMSRGGYRSWCENQKQQIEEMYAAGLRPSIDRVDGDGHYELSNIRVLPFAQNCLLGAKR